MYIETVKIKKTSLNKNELDDLVKSELLSRGFISKKKATQVSYEVGDDGSIYNVTVAETIHTKVACITSS